MSRTFLVWSLLFGLALVGADWYVEYGQGATSVVPSAADGLVTATDDGTPAPRPPKY